MTRVPRSPRSNAGASCSAPIAARPPVCSTKRQAASTFGAIDPGAKFIMRSSCTVTSVSGCACGVPQSAGTVAAQHAGAGVQVDPRPWAVGSIAETFRSYPHIGSVLPAMGYTDQQLHELQETVNATDCDAVIAGTPVDLARLISCRHPIRKATYELRELGEPTIAELLEPIIAAHRREPPRTP